jgi:hypothetical protein
MCNPQIKNVEQKVEEFIVFCVDKVLERIERRVHEMPSSLKFVRDKTFAVLLLACENVIFHVEQLSPQHSNTFELRDSYEELRIENAHIKERFMENFLEERFVKVRYLIWSKVPIKYDSGGNHEFVHFVTL